MPTVTEQEVEGYAHCVQARCPGNTQQRVKAFRRETSRTYREMGGDSPGVETSWVALVFADADESGCPHCGRHRELTDQPRKSYAPLSGHDPMGLLGAPQFNAAKQQELRSQPLADPEREALTAQNEALQEQLAAQQAQIDAIIAAQGKET